MLNRVTAVAALMLAPLAAQEHNSQGYAFFAPASERVIHLGAGGEGFLYKGLALGGEAGYAFTKGQFPYGVGVLGINTSHHLNRGTHWKIQPFVAAGYTLMFRIEATRFTNVGGGLNYWLSDRAGLRLEYRQYFGPRQYDPFREFRIGLAFR